MVENLLLSAAMSQLPGIAELEERISDLEAKTAMLIARFEIEFTMLKHQVEGQARLHELHMQWAKEVESRIMLLELKASEKK